MQSRHGIVITAIAIILFLLLSLAAEAALDTGVNQTGNHTAFNVTSNSFTEVAGANLSLTSTAAGTYYGMFIAEVRTNWTGAQGQAKVIMDGTTLGTYNLTSLTYFTTTPLMFAVPVSAGDHYLTVQMAVENVSAKQRIMYVHKWNMTTAFMRDFDVNASVQIAGVSQVTGLRGEQDAQNASITALQVNDTTHDAKFNNVNTTTAALQLNDTGINSTIDSRTTEFRGNDTNINGSIASITTEFRGNDTNINGSIAGLTSEFRGNDTNINGSIQAITSEFRTNDTNINGTINGWLNQGVRTTDSPTFDTVNANVSGDWINTTDGKQLSNIVSGASYTIVQEAGTVRDCGVVVLSCIKAINGSTLAVEFSGTNTSYAINSALNSAPDFGTVLILAQPVLTYTHQINIPSKRTLVLDGVLRLDDGAAANIPTTTASNGIIRNSDNTNGNNNITIIVRSGYFDFNRPTQGTDGQYAINGIKFHRVDGLYLYNLRVKDSVNAALRIDKVNNSIINNFERLYNESLAWMTAENEFFIVDSRDVIISNLLGVSNDDFVSFHADYRDISNITINNINGRSLHADMIRFATGEAGIAGNKIKNVVINGVQGYDVGTYYVGQGVVFGAPGDSDGSYEGIQINGLQIFNVSRGLVKFGESTKNLSYKDIKISGTVNKTGNHAVVILGNNTIDDLELDVRITDIASGFEGIRVLGNLSNFTFSGKIDYKNEGKSPQMDIEFASGSVVRDGTIDMDMFGGLRGAYLNGTSTNVTIKDSTLQGMSQKAIHEAGTNSGNLFYNNRIVGSTGFTIGNGVAYQNYGIAGFDWYLRTTAPTNMEVDDRYTNSTSHLICYKVNSTTVVNLQNWTSVGC